VKIRRALVPLLLVPTALTACGGDDSGSAAGDDAGSDATTSASASASTDSNPDGNPDSDTDTGNDVAACDVVTTDEVAAAVGSPVKPGIASSGQPVTGGTFTTCVWQSADPATPADTATLTVYSNTAAADSAREDDSQELDGIGDQAFSAMVSSVWVYVGDRSFFAQWYKFGTMDDEGLEQSKALAKAVADKL
jgi:hypothetical protein